ncbi:MAG: hypothetical protein FWF44_07485 [Defluviitaleaceae bacterium]|nr:hypothetical protein [Defluviitaleaceae bacterium]
MRIEAITKINTSKQYNPGVSKPAGILTAGKSAPLVSFEECLRAQIQDVRSQAKTCEMEGQAAKLFGGFQMISPGIPFKTELRLRARGYEPMSDL